MTVDRKEQVSRFVRNEQIDETQQTDLENLFPSRRSPFLPQLELTVLSIDFEESVKPSGTRIGCRAADKFEDQLFCNELHHGEKVTGTVEVDIPNVVLSESLVHDRMLGQVEREGAYRLKFPILHEGLQRSRRDRLSTDVQTAIIAKVKCMVSTSHDALPLIRLNG